jgi:hypothetical protein
MRYSVEAVQFVMRFLLALPTWQREWYKRTAMQKDGHTFVNDWISNKPGLEFDLALCVLTILVYVIVRGRLLIGNRLS